MSSKKLAGVIVLLVYLAWSSFLPSGSSKKTKKPVELLDQAASSSTPSGVLVTRVIDGDTIEIEGGFKVRYIGIDSPETVDPRRTVACFGKEASDQNKKMVEGKKVRLEKDASDTDKFGRLLRYVYVDDIFVNEYLVRQGYAQASSYPPDVRFGQLFIEAQRDARDHFRGLWRKC